MATLKISELSVGDWVRYGGRDYQVKEIDGFCNRVSLVGNKEQRVESIKSIHPIPITAEMLESNGFECVEEDVDIALYGTPSCSIFHTKGISRYRLDTPQASVACWNIHDLQHALRLAGVDKEINL